MFIGISKALPDTAYMKLIDVWLIFNLLVPFVEVMLHTAIDILSSWDDDPGPRGRQAKKAAAWSNPAAAAARGEPPSASGKKWVLRRRRMLRHTIMFGRVGLPAIFIAFCVMFIAHGMNRAVNDHRMNK